MQAWLEGFGPSSEPLHEAFGALPHFLVGIGAPAATKRKPSSQTASLVTAALEDRFVAGALVLPVVKLMVDFSLLLHHSNMYYKWR